MRFLNWFKGEELPSKEEAINNFNTAFGKAAEQFLYPYGSDTRMVKILQKSFSDAILTSLPGTSGIKQLGKVTERLKSNPENIVFLTQVLPIHQLAMLHLAGFMELSIQIKKLITSGESTILHVLRKRTRDAMEEEAINHKTGTLSDTEKKKVADQVLNIWTFLVWKKTGGPCTQAEIIEAFQEIEQVRIIDDEEEVIQERLSEKIDDMRSAMTQAVSNTIDALVKHVEPIIGIDNCVDNLSTLSTGDVIVSTGHTYRYITHIDSPPKVQAKNVQEIKDQLASTIVTYTAFKKDDEGNFQLREEKSGSMDAMKLLQSGTVVCIYKGSDLAKKEHKKN